MAGRRAWRRTSLAPPCEEGQIHTYYNRLCSPINLLHTARFAAFGAIAERLSLLPAQVRHREQLLPPRVGKRTGLFRDKPRSVGVSEDAFRCAWKSYRSAKS